MDILKKIFFSSLFFIQIIYSQVYRSGDKFNLTKTQEFWLQLDDIFNDPNFSSANWGVVIKSLETGEYLYKRNEDKLFMPASNLKLFTTSAGLLLLGKYYHFRTNVYITGSIDGSTVQGNLVVQGLGDPTISGRFYNNDPYYVFNKWADTLLKLGIDEINGNIVGDDNAFDDLSLGSGWAWDNESSWFAAPSGAISFNDNCIDITILPTKADFPARIQKFPDTRYVTILNKVITANTNTVPDINIYRERGTNVITVFGKIAENSDEKKTQATVNNPTQFSMVVLKEVLESKGIKVSGYAADLDDEAQELDYNRMTKLFTFFSPPLMNIIKVINKNSQNLYAEQLLKVIGFEKDGYGSISNGVKEIKNLLKEIGINPENIIIADGSGLSRLNLVTPRQFVDLLTFISKSEVFQLFYDSLPIAGTDGTLARRMRNTKAENNIRAKTGYIEGVRSICGYAYTADKELVAFSIIVNNYIVPYALADNLQDLVCLRLANFSRK
jgi:D-alanyl-D-alanine carboxypeptidase/D-alanyl-D-alanine-endopeptidase (penicillin-binding protein 4)